MVQDQEEPELSLAYYKNKDTLYSTYYRNSEEIQGDLIEDIFIQRYPIVLVSVPGELVQEDFPRVILYEEMGEHVIIASILDVIGHYTNGEFHAIKFSDTIIFEQIPQRREEVLQGLELCIGDSLAAEITLYLLLSKIHERSALIGTLAINFTNLEETKSIINSLAKIIRTVVLPLSLSVLNTEDFIPKKNIDEKLSKSLLQIPNGSLLIIDETKLTPGSLTSKGIENFNTLVQLVQSQQLSYDFGYSKLNFPTDLKILVLSQGKSLIKPSIIINLSNSFQEFEFSLEDKLYIQACSEIFVSLPEEITTVAQEFFVNQRKDNNITVENLHLLLTLTRYCAQSFGQTTAERKHWDHAVSLFSQLNYRNKHKDV